MSDPNRPGYEHCPVCNDWFYHFHLKDHQQRHALEADCKLVRYRQGDLLKHIVGLPDVERIYVPHIVNDEKRWGAGFVVPLGRMFPEARIAYLDWPVVSEDRHDGMDLGRIQSVEVRKSPRIYVVNMCAQHGVGGHRPLRYNALARCMDQLAMVVRAAPGQIHCPLFGSGLAGGNWDFIEHLIHDCWLERGIPVTAYYLPDSIPSGWSPMPLTEGRFSGN